MTAARAELVGTVVVVGAGVVFSVLAYKAVRKLLGGIPDALGGAPPAADGTSRDSVPWWAVPGVAGNDLGSPAGALLGPGPTASDASGYNLDAIPGPGSLFQRFRNFIGGK